MPRPSREKKESKKSRVLNSLQKEIDKAQIIEHNKNLSASPNNSFKNISVRSFKERLMGPADIEKLSLALVNWAENEKEARRINWFLRKSDIFYDDFMELAKKFPTLEKARKWALYALGDLREYEAIYGPGKSIPLMASLPYYCPEWQEVIAWRASLNKDANENDVERTKRALLETLEDLAIRRKGNAQNKNDDVQEKTK